MSLSSPPMDIFVAVLLRVTPETGTLARVTDTLHVAVFAPSWVMAVIRALPIDLAVTRPLSATPATALSLLVQVTLPLVEFNGCTVAINESVLPTINRAEFLFNVTPVTLTATVTLHVFTWPPSRVATAIVVVPEPTATTVPLFTLATAGVLLVQLTSLSVAFIGWTVAVRVFMPPTVRVRSS